MDRTNSRTVLAGCVIAALVAAAACGGGSKPETTVAPQPNPDSVAAAERARQDSLAAVEKARQDSLAAAEKARQDSLAAEAERAARQHTADSLAALERAAETARATLATMINFDFDQSNIRSDDAALLDQKVAILGANTDVRIRVSGHCDERGSAKYNLALGNRRAAAAKQYLVHHGIDAGRIETHSYGKERPIAPGHDESAWAQNRRDEFEIVSGGLAVRQP